MPNMCASIRPEQRMDCGWPGVTKFSCENKRCCYDDSVSGFPWCFRNYPGMCIYSLLSSPIDRIHKWPPACMQLKEGLNNCKNYIKMNHKV